MLEDAVVEQPEEIGRIKLEEPGEAVTKVWPNEDEGCVRYECTLFSSVMGSCISFGKCSRYSSSSLT